MFVRDVKHVAVFVPGQHAVLLCITSSRAVGCKCVHRASKSITVQCHDFSEGARIDEHGCPGLFLDGLRSVGASPLTEMPLIMQEKL